MAIILYLSWLLLFPAILAFVFARLQPGYRWPSGVAVVTVSAGIPSASALLSAQGADAITSAASLVVVPVIFFLALFFAVMGLGLGGLRR